MFSLFIWGKLAAGAASPPYGEGLMEIELDRVLLGRRVAVHRIRPVGIGDRWQAARVNEGQDWPRGALT